MKELKREQKRQFVHDKIVEVNRATKRKQATVTFVIDDDLAKRLIGFQMARARYFDSDFPVVGIMLEWTNVDYLEPVDIANETGAKNAT